MNFALAGQPKASKQAFSIDFSHTFFGKKKLEFLEEVAGKHVFCFCLFAGSWNAMYFVSAGWWLESHVFCFCIGRRLESHVFCFCWVVAGKPCVLFL